MNKVLLFSRNDLVHLYGGMSRYLSSSLELVHLAYSRVEEKILREEYNIENVINFQREVEKILQEEKADAELINRIDQLIIEQTEGRFCLNASIQSDRTFSGLNYEDVLLLVQVYYRFWTDLLERNNIRFILHEPVALFFLQIAAVICKQRGGMYLTQIQVFGENPFNWIFVSAEDGFAVEMPELLNSPKEIDRDKVEKYLASFRKDFELLLPELATRNKSLTNAGFMKFVFNVAKSIVKYSLRRLSEKKKNFSLLEHVERYAYYSIPGLADHLKNLWDEYFHIKYDPFDPSKDYYYYPMHTEPEAVVLYWGDGIYKNQVKLIENIAGQLPPGHYLYVKYHPVMKEERNYVDYKRIKAIPNVLLIGQDTPGKRITSHCKGLITINGTSGFEAVLLNKPVFVFGNSFYDLSDRVYKVNNIKEFRSILYSTLTKKFEDDENLIRFVDAFLQISNEGYTAYYSNYRELLKVERDKNSKEVSASVKKFLANCC
jgi:hypothetical protein